MKAIKKIFLLSVILSASDFFKLIYFEDQIKYFQLAIISCLVIIVIMGIISDRRSVFSFKYPIIFILASVFLSMYIALVDHQQPLDISILASRPMYFYLLYFALQYIKMEKKDVLQVIIISAFIYAFFYLYQISIYPRLLVTAHILQERGTTRIQMTGIEPLFVAILYFMGRYLTDKKVLFLFMSAFFIIILFVDASRIRILTMLIAVIWLFFNLSKENKKLIAFIGIMSVITLLVVFWENIQLLVELTLNQISQGKSYVRFQSADFYLNTIYKSNLGYLFGNGIASTNSSYGMMIKYFEDNYLYRFYQSDIGLLGDFSRFGVLYILAVLALFYKVIRAKINNDNLFIKAYFIMALISSFTLIFFGSAYAAVIICCLLYLIDIQKSNDNTYVNPQKI
jgi:hypothetical protein